MSRSITHFATDAALDGAVARRLDEYVDVLAQLVRVPSLAGGERPAQDVVAGRLEALGFAVRWVELMDEVAETPGGGRPVAPVAGRAALVAERGGTSPASLILNGHIDVVPPGDEGLWTNPPFSPVVRDGWLYGRGAGDMKGGLAMALLALQALRECAPAALDADLTVVVVPEEESSGNGTLATILAGVRADAVVLPEPTDLDVLIGGVGVLWCDVLVRGGGAHAGSGAKVVNPLDKAIGLAARIRDLETTFAALSPAAADRGQRFAVNVGAITGGDWPSAVPASARVRLRIGFPPELTVADTEAIVRATVAETVRGDEWLLLNPPDLVFRGLRAEPHRIDPGHTLVRAVRAAHRACHDGDPAVVDGSATSDARFYLNQGGIPAVCYGPRTRGIHGVDEAVELASIADGARTLTRLIPALLAGPSEVTR
jgi:acetylornithine deacetylase